MIKWANAQTAKATVVEINECDKIMDRLADNAADAIEELLRDDSVSVEDAKAVIRNLIDNAKSGIQSMTEEATLIKE